MILLNPVDVKCIVLHCSVSAFGDVDTITQWHTEKGYSTIGYHWVITNCFATSESIRDKQPNLALDGAVHKGRSEKFRGAHAKGHNWETIGVCLIGGVTPDGSYIGFTSRQLESAAKLCYEIKQRFPNSLDVKGHCEFAYTTKTCPELDMNFFRDFILPNVEEPVDPMFDPTILLK